MLRALKLSQGAVVLGYSEILKKTCFYRQNFTKIGPSAAELWLKTIFNMAVVRHF